MNDERKGKTVLCSSFIIHHSSFLQWCNVQDGVNLVPVPLGLRVVAGHAVDPHVTALAGGRHRDGAHDLTDDERPRSAPVFEKFERNGPLFFIGMNIAHKALGGDMRFGVKLEVSNADLVKLAEVESPGSHRGSTSLSKQEFPVGGHQEDELQHYHRGEYRDPSCGGQAIEPVQATAASWPIV